MIFSISQICDALTPCDIMLQGTDNTEYRLGVSPNGLVQFEGKIKRATHIWPLIDAVDFNKSSLHIRVKDTQVDVASTARVLLNLAQQWN